MPRMIKEDWRTQAACLHVDPDLFFPDGRGARIAEQLAEARLVCERCPVAGRCLSWALASRQEHGVWGGLTEDERRAVLRTRAEQAERARWLPRMDSAGPSSVTGK